MAAIKYIANSRYDCIPKYRDFYVGFELDLFIGKRSQQSKAQVSYHPSTNLYIETIFIILS